MKKLLIISDYYYPHWTGISKSVQNFTRGMEDHFEMEILTVRYDKKLKKTEKIKGIKILRENPIFTISRSKYSIDIVIKFFRIVKNYDVVAINSPCANILPMSLIAKFFRKKIIIFSHGDLILPRGILNSFIMKIFDLSSFASFYLADKVSTFTLDYAQNSRVIKPFLYKFAPALWPIYLSKDFSEIPKIKDLEKLKKQGFKIFGFSGRFVEEKGFDILFDAIKVIQKENIKIIFVYAGQTEIWYEDFYSKQKNKGKKIEKNIVFLGLLNSKEMTSFYKLIDFIVVPSRSDCFPLVQAEAMLLGVPSIVSNIHGARFLVRETGFGLMFEKENASDLASKIISAFKDKKKIYSNRDKVRKILDNKKNAKEIKSLIG